MPYNGKYIPEKEQEIILVGIKYEKIAKMRTKIKVRNETSERLTEERLKFQITGRESDESLEARPPKRAAWYIQVWTTSGS